MSKEEFLSMISNELDILGEEHKTAYKKVLYFKEINPTGKEFEEAWYELDMIDGIIETLRKFVNLPAYARIQVMSDAEIKEYKKGKVEELKSKLKDIESRKNQANEKSVQLKAEQEQLINQFGSLSDREKNIAIQRGKQIYTEISRYDATTIEREIDEVKKQQDRIMAMTSQEIKQQLSSEIKENLSLAKTLKSARDPIDDFTELEASVASDPEKAQKLAEVLQRYKGYYDNKHKIANSVYIGDELPKALDDKIIGYHITEGFVNDTGLLMNVVQEFEDSFKKAKTSFNEQFTEQKLSKLVCYMDDSPEVDVDMDFLQQHADKLSDGKLEDLQSLVEQKKKLSKKIFKTRDTKDEIEDLNRKIKKEKSEIYEDIIRWYKSRSVKYLGEYFYGIGNGVQFSSIEDLQESLKRCKKGIDRTEQIINMIKENIQTAKENAEQQRQFNENLMAEAAREIRALGGEKYKDTPIEYFSDSISENLYQIRYAKRISYQRDIVNKVQKEAQKQADEKEADLKRLLKK